MSRASKPHPASDHGASDSDPGCNSIGGRRAAREARRGPRPGGWRMAHGTRHRDGNVVGMYIPRYIPNYLTGRCSNSEKRRKAYLSFCPSFRQITWRQFTNYLPTYLGIYRYLPTTCLPGRNLCRFSMHEMCKSCLLGLEPGRQAGSDGAQLLKQVPIHLPGSPQHGLGEKSPKEDFSLDDAGLPQRGCEGASRCRNRTQYAN